MRKQPSRTVAVIVAHPDDEVLAFGGVIRRHAAAGDKVHILFLATGLAARDAKGRADRRALSALRDDARAAGDKLGVSGVVFADFPDNRMDSVPRLDVVKRIEDFLGKTNPDLILTHHRNDLNIDHRITAEGVLTALRPLPGRAPFRIYAGEVLSATEYGWPENRFAPTTYVDIATHLKSKLAALACYRSELRPWPHPRSSEAVVNLARLRGSECGREAAEALCLIRHVII